jgi:hypothetical protein
MHRFQLEDIFYYHPAEIVAMAILGNLPAQPWVLGGSRADVVCFSDSMQLEYWVDRGLTRSKTEVIGNLDLHDLEKQIGRVLRQNTTLLDRLGPLILINMPNLIEHNIISEWEVFWGHIDKILKPLKIYHKILVINLHPKSDQSKYNWMMEKYGCIVTKGNIAAWMALADLYISCCSSTESVACELGVQVIDIGKIFGFTSDVLVTISQIEFVNTYEEYEIALIKTLQSRAYEARRTKSSTTENNNNDFSPYEKLRSVINQYLT